MGRTTPKGEVQPGRPHRIRRDQEERGQIARIRHDPLLVSRSSRKGSRLVKYCALKKRNNKQNQSSKKEKYKELIMWWWADVCRKKKIKIKFLLQCDDSSNAHPHIHHRHRNTHTHT